jgi:[protein-PII] uridylyltransferase
MEVITTDRPGVLAKIGQAMDVCHVTLQSAKVATFGNRAEDIFYVVDAHGQPLDDEMKKRLRQTIIEYLEEL